MSEALEIRHCLSCEEWRAHRFRVTAEPRAGPLPNDKSPIGPDFVSIRDFFGTSRKSVRFCFHPSSFACLTIVRSCTWNFFASSVGPIPCSTYSHSTACQKFSLMSRFVTLRGFWRDITRFRSLSGSFLDLLFFRRLYISSKSLSRKA